MLPIFNLCFDCCSLYLFFCHSHYFGGMLCNVLYFSTLTAEEGRLARNMFI